MTKKTVTPKMYALSTIIFFTILALLIMTNLIDTTPGVERQGKERRERSAKQVKQLRLAGAIGAVLAMCMLVIVIVGVMNFNSGRAQKKEAEKA